MSGDMSGVIIPKSDQLNSDDLISGPITIKITGVTIKPGEQPVSIFYEGDNGKPYKCCKSMARILVSAWGADSKRYVGRSLTLYRDASVKWGGLEVGGIRISHMTDIAEPMTMALTMTKQSRKPFTVRPLVKASTGTQTAERATAGGDLSPPSNDSASPVDPYISVEEQLEISDECRKLGNCLPLLLKAASKATGTEIVSIAKMPTTSLADCREWIQARRARTATA